MESMFPGLEESADKRPARRASKKHDLVKVATGSAGGGKARKVGKGGTRIFLEGLWLARSGFEAFGEATVLLDREPVEVEVLARRAQVPGQPPARLEPGPQSEAELDRADRDRDGRTAGDLGQAAKQAGQAVGEIDPGTV